ncbi:MAG: Molybdenum transport system permease protein ModB [Myxococcales bacterium]|nr:Molybdenum transport system permease protein ModB [Myxococcales bacterium]
MSYRTLGILAALLALGITVLSRLDVLPGAAWAPLFLSIRIASLSMLLALVAGTAFALALHSKRMPARELFDAIVSAPLVLPPTVLGYYLLVALGTESAIGRAWENLTGTTIVFSFTGAVIAAAVGSLPLVVRSARVALEAVDPSLIAAARTLGARPLRVLFTVLLPLAAPGIAAGAMLAFARALGDYGITQMVAGQMINGTETASIHVMNALYGGHEDAARNMAIVTTVVGISLLYIANRFVRRSSNRV